MKQFLKWKDKLVKWYWLQVYIIGGIVDRVAERGIPKKASKEAADEEGVKSVRLPINRYVKWVVR